MNHYKLGKLAPKRDPRTFQAARYLGAVPKPPAAADWASTLPLIPMYANDKLGDCTCASAGHKIAAWTFYTTRSETVLDDADIIKAYCDVSGYNGDPSTDNGAAMLDVLKYWRKVGIGGHKIGAFVQIDPKNKLEVMQAIWLFGGVYTGVSLPTSAQKELGKVWQSHWYARPGTWGGHAIGVNKYNADGLTCFTWGSLQRMTWGFWNKYVDECYAVLSADFLKGNVAPNGFDVATLQKDLAAL